MRNQSIYMKTNRMRSIHAQISLYLLHTLHHGRICLLCTESRQVEERYGSSVGGTSIFALNFASSNSPVILRWNCPPWTALKSGGGTKTPHNIAFLLVQVEDAIGDRHYGISIVWANPSQVRAASMEKVVKKLTDCTSSGTDWFYTLVWLHKGTCHVPLPKEGHLGILPQRGAEATPCGQISQLEVCQLLVVSPQVIYPVGLNGQDEPVITSLPEPLASSINLTAGKPIHFGIDIPSPPMEEPDQKIPPLGEVSTIIVASPHKSPPKLEGSMTMEVRNLLSQAILETSSCGFKHSSPRRPTRAEVPMTPPQKPEGPPKPVDTSSQVSTKVMEASLEDIPTSISPIAAVSRTGSITPLVDKLELQANANKALKDFLTTKVSIDVCRWKAMWELSIALCQSESQAAESIKEAKAACSQAILDAQTTCSH